MATLHRITPRPTMLGSSRPPDATKAAALLLLQFRTIATQEITPPRITTTTTTLPPRKLRAVSFGSGDLLTDYEEEDDYDDGDSIDSLPRKSTINYVGQSVSGPIQAVLRKKFSWKSFPQLEQFLIDHRAEYMLYSSQWNYTAEQKRYNNRLTTELLDLAAGHGYQFEGFTFAAIRDRIRCYYKSYVQASKKRKRRRSK